VEGLDPVRAAAVEPWEVYTRFEWCGCGYRAVAISASNGLRDVVLTKVEAFPELLFGKRSVQHHCTYRLPYPHFNEQMLTCGSSAIRAQYELTPCTLARCGGSRKERIRRKISWCVTSSSILLRVGASDPVGSARRVCLALAIIRYHLI
jgi:hypothetical protein